MSACTAGAFRPARIQYWLAWKAGCGLGPASAIACSYCQLRPSARATWRSGVCIQRSARAGDTRSAGSLPMRPPVSIRTPGLSANAAEGAMRASAQSAAEKKLAARVIRRIVSGLTGW